MNQECEKFPLVLEILTYNHEFKVAI